MIEEIFSSLSSLGYAGVFLISLIGSLTIVFPLPAAAFVFALAALFNPLWIGILAGLGSALGELTGYVLGWGGRQLSQKRFQAEIERARLLFDKYGGFLVLVLFAATPLPDDVAGVISGILKYDVKKFFIAVLIGKTIFHLIVAYAGFWGINSILKYI